MVEIMTMGDARAVAHSAPKIGSSSSGSWCVMCGVSCMFCTWYLVKSALYFGRLTRWDGARVHSMCIPLTLERRLQAGATHFMLLDLVIVGVLRFGLGELVLIGRCGEPGLGDGRGVGELVLWQFHSFSEG